MGLDSIANYATFEIIMLKLSENKWENCVIGRFVAVAIRAARLYTAWFYHQSYVVLGLKKFK